MKTKVIEFISSMSDGGAETLVKDYACLLDKEQFEMKVVCYYDLMDTANGETCHQNGIRIIPIFPKYSLTYRVMKVLIGEWYIPYKLRKIIRSEKPDCLHVHLSCVKYLKPMSKELKKIRLLFTCHNPPEIMLEGKNADVGEAVGYLIKNNNMQVIALHKQMADELNAKFSIHNTVVIKNGVNFDRFRNVPESRELIRKGINIPEDAFVVGHIGRFTTQKNHGYLIDVFTETYKLKDNAYLLLIGEGELKDAIRNKINLLRMNQRVVVLANRTDIPQLLKAMDVFVFPSLFEGLAVTLVEAQVSGLKCVVSSNINREAILSDKTIIMSINSPPKEWAKNIIDNSIRQNTFGNIDEYNMKLEIRHLEDLYKGIKF